MKIFDQHVHSEFSFDSNQSIEEYINLAISKKLDFFILTDHYDLNYLDSGRNLTFDIKKQDEFLTHLQNKYPDIKILRGIEIGYKPNELIKINNVLKDNKFDLVNLSLHESYGIDYYYPDAFLEKGIDQTLKLYFKSILDAVEHFDNFDVLSHIDYGFKSVYLVDKTQSISKYEDELTKIFKVLIKKDKALEINTKVQEVLPIEHTKYLLKLYKSVGGVNLTLSSDAHEKQRFCSSFEKYINIIKECRFKNLSYFVNRKRFAVEI